MSPSFAVHVHGGQNDTKYVTFELLHAAFVADENWGDMLEPARIAREKSNQTLWNNILKLQRQCRGPQMARKLLSLCHTTVVRTPKNPLPGGEIFGSTVLLQLWQNCECRTKKIQR